MEKKTQNLLLLGLAGIGIYYFLKNKSLPIVPTTTAELQPPVEQIKAPVEPVYQPPVFEERDPVYKEPIINASRVDNSNLQTESSIITNSTNKYQDSVTEFANSQDWLGMLYEEDYPIEYDFEQKRK
jgi:hypothetical protein